MSLQKTGIGIDVPHTQGAKPSNYVGFFFAQRTGFASMEGRVGEPKGSPVTCGWNVNPARFSTLIDVGVADIYPHTRSNTMSHISAATPANKFSTFPGIEITVSADGMADYLETRSSQLSALSALLCVEGFDNFNPAIKANAIWLANSLSEELRSLVQLSINGVSA